MSEEGLPSARQGSQHHIAFPNLAPGVVRASKDLRGLSNELLGRVPVRSVRFDSRASTRRGAVPPFNTVRNLTVLGKVVIAGSQNTLVDVDYRGGVEDRGLMNKY